MTEITNEMWEEAREIILQTIKKCENFSELANALDLSKRYVRGERSTELYNAIMGLK